ncbi:uncharacterized protein M437DRAFT_53655 [Aureobasidium melanogenum CBS 110374]|uniref:Uncharacterized protein n=1 Tax=Aureobasidium melanogenum (strain CBS 110374) TaxID=1043003 RepID=A0A074VNK3_AURM1|nr:uncharacterized protein M437DRAFT_53655 [Aureobasidium melanogenum CBS 110374]KEQ60659.1 hypothetical protein M437DRAFT_53655 [Aureobasidium melanogenum CBS 110374]
MASINTKDSDAISETSTLAGSLSTTDYVPRKSTNKNNNNNNTNFIALQTLLEAPELEQSSSLHARETIVESQAVVKKNKRRKIYWIIGLTTFGCCTVLGAILAVIFGPRPVQQEHSW